MAKAPSPRALLPAALIAMVAAGEARAQATVAEPLPPDPYGVFAFILENDTFGGTDKYYTNGFLFAWRAPSYNPPAWLGALTDRPSLLFPAGGTARWGLSFGQKKFTPEETLLFNPDPNDRPYAGWLYGSVALYSSTATELGSLELQFGVVGPAALGQQVQNITHDLMQIDRAFGWRSQLKDEPGVNLILARQWRYNQPFGDGGLAWGVVPNVTVSLGNVQTYASVGGLLRIGNDLEADFGPPRARPASAGSTFFEPTGRWGWYGFAGVEGRAVGRDIFLDGNTWRDSRSVEREDFVVDATLGVALMMPRARLTASYTIRSQEFVAQREAAQFGSVSIAFRF